MHHAVFIGYTRNIYVVYLPHIRSLVTYSALSLSPPSVSLQGSYAHGGEALLVHLRGSLKNTRGLQLAVSGDLRQSMANLAALPPVLGLDGVLGQSDTLIEGRRC